MSKCSPRVTDITWDSYLPLRPDNFSAHTWKQFMFLPTTAQHCIEVNATTYTYGYGICGITVNCIFDRPYCVGRWKEHEKSPLHKETLQNQTRRRIIRLKDKSKTKRLTIL